MYSKGYTQYYKLPLIFVSYNIIVYSLYKLYLFVFYLIIQYLICIFFLFKS